MGTYWRVISTGIIRRILLYWNLRSRRARLLTWHRTSRCHWAEEPRYWVWPHGAMSVSWTSHNLVYRMITGRKRSGCVHADKSNLLLLEKFSMNADQWCFVEVIFFITVPYERTTTGSIYAQSIIESISLCAMNLGKNFIFQNDSARQHCAQRV